MVRLHLVNTEPHLQDSTARRLQDNTVHHHQGSMAHHLHRRVDTVLSRDMVDSRVGTGSNWAMGNRLLSKGGIRDSKGIIHRVMGKGGDIVLRRRRLGIRF